MLSLLLVLAPASLRAQPADGDENPGVSPAPASGASLRDSLGADTALQNATIIALRTALGAREQVAVVRRGRFVDDIRFYLESYRSIRDTTIQANIQNRYSAARAELLEPRLPERIAQLVELLETLD